MPVWRPSGTRSLALSGLWVAAIGFFVTRFTVALAAFETRTQFFLLGLTPLVLGLGLAAFGVALVVGQFDPPRVRVVAVWCTAGTLAMGALVGLVLLGAGDGTVTGLFAARNRGSRRQLRQQTNQLVTVNRILRHEVLNAVAIIRGRAEVVGDVPPDEADAGHIRSEADRIVAAIEDVKHLSRTASASREGLFPVSLAEVVEESVELARERHPDVAFSIERGDAGDVEVWADDRLQHALYPLVDNAARHNDAEDPRVTLSLVAGRDRACVVIADNGPGMPEEHRATLERGDITDYDDPGAGFGTNVTRMYLDGFGGGVDAAVDEDGTTIEVSLRVATGRRPAWNDVGSLDAVGVSRRRLAVVTAASLAAAFGMGAFMQSVAGVMPVIGALYGVADPLVGWVTHAFHSVVFGLVYVGQLRVLPAGAGERFRDRLLVGLGWGVALWLVAASLVMPVWLNLVGVPAPVPNVSPVSFASHLLWGGLLAVGYHAGVAVDTTAPAVQAVAAEAD